MELCKVIFNLKPQLMYRPTVVLPEPVTVDVDMLSDPWKDGARRHHRASRPNEARSRFLRIPAVVLLRVSESFSFRLPRSDDGNRLKRDNGNRPRRDDSNRPRREDSNRPVRDPGQQRGSGKQSLFRQSTW
ncbi:hypothetical protein BV25DRAFT_1994627 [Artomyces pyxidatus]|uniref:Uncharacterized protein n=1 Tax=Artomyces pyxidatus TaxID=48021 RepID=A0ACB8SPA0_9AGAM|nr:hypothetical protein BV25DRAFT_1994627 [Artomyces pyxidatus]